MTNDQRAARGRAAVHAYIKVYDDFDPNDLNTMWIDLLTDLRHEANQFKVKVVDFNRAIIMSAIHFNEEVSQDG